MSCNNFYPCCSYMPQCNTKKTYDNSCGKCMCSKPCKKKKYCQCKPEYPCRPECQPCLPPCPPPIRIQPQPTVSYSTTAPTATAVPTGTANTVGTPTTITSFSTAPIVNGGFAASGVANTTCINGVITTGFAGQTLINAGLTTANNLSFGTLTGAVSNTNNIITLNTVTGQFTIPTNGYYLITAFVGFADAGTAGQGVGTRQLYIYKIDGTTNTVTLLAEDSRNAVTSGNTYISIATVAEFSPNDRLYFAVGQNSLVALSTTTDGRFTITRIR